VRALEAHGLVRLAGERRWGGLTERRLVATATSYVVSPAALGEVASDPARTADRLSARYLVALAARVVREVGALARRSDEQDKRLATLAVRSVHVAGTKGKGSTCAMLASMLQACGYKVGLYTSPHLNDIRERIVVNGLLVGGSTGVVRAGSSAVRAAQTGFLRYYAALVVLGMVVIAFYFLVAA